VAQGSGLRPPKPGNQALSSVGSTLDERCACIECYHAGMKSPSDSIQYTVRGVPPEVDRVLRQRAAQRNQSLNQLILDELTLATVARRQHADFSDLVGRWTPDPGFDEIMAAQRQVDWDKWK
jgi:Antitoxin FitA-like, ribbon-helix-helix